MTDSSDSPSFQRSLFSLLPLSALFSFFARQPHLPRRQTTLLPPARSAVCATHHQSSPPARPTQNPQDNLVLGADSVSHLAASSHSFPLSLSPFLPRAAVHFRLLRRDQTWLPCFVPETPSSLSATREFSSDSRLVPPCNASFFPPATRSLLQSDPTPGFEVRVSTTFCFLLHFLKRSLSALRPVWLRLACHRRSQQDCPPSIDRCISSHDPTCYYSQTRSFCRSASLLSTFLILVILAAPADDTRVAIL